MYETYLTLNTNGKSPENKEICCEKNAIESAQPIEEFSR